MIFARCLYKKVRVWDIDQAEDYAQFLKTIMSELAADPETGRPVSGRPDLRSYIARWKRAKHGHHIVYEETPTGIFVLRILHTAMNLQDHV